MKRKANRVVAMPASDAARKGAVDHWRDRQGPEHTEIDEQVDKDRPREAAVAGKIPPAPHDKHDGQKTRGETATPSTTPRTA